MPPERRLIYELINNHRLSGHKGTHPRAANLGIYEPRRVGDPHQLASGRRLKLARLQTCDAPQITRSNFDALRGLSGRLDRRRGPHPIAGPQERDQYQ